MSVDRRTMLKLGLLTSAGMGLLPACLQESRPAASWVHLDISRRQQEVLTELAEELLPHTVAPGAKDLSLVRFVLRMIDDCATPQEQAAFTDGLSAFERETEKRTGSTFLSLSREARQGWLTTLEQVSDNGKGYATFYQTFKDLLIKGYTTSEYYLTRVQVYELMPARYHGCVPLKSS